MTVRYLEVDKILALIGLIGMFIYNGFILIRYKKIPGSLSETAYLISGNGENLKKYWFTFYCLFTAVTILPPLFSETSDSLQFIPYILCSGLLFAGFSPAYKDGVDKKVHYVSAIISFCSYLFYGFFCMPWYWLVSFVILLGLLCLWKNKYYVYFAEILAVTSIYLWILL
jgi:hypothetical protein